jgi:hypothetical protein
LIKVKEILHFTVLTHLKFCKFYCSLAILPIRKVFTTMFPKNLKKNTAVFLDARKEVGLEVNS